jgi:hypothetical protein
VTPRAVAPASRAARMLICVALWFLPAACQARYRREWLAELEEMEHENVAPVLPAIRILLGAPSVGRTLRVSAQQRRGLGEQVAAVSTYDAYMTYSHAGDQQLAAELHKDLMRLAKPWYRSRSMRVFRDSADIAASPNLWASVEGALKSSRWLVLLASRGAANSSWVAQEVNCWLKKKRPDRILIVLTDGDIVWDPVAGDFNWALTTALPTALQGAFSNEPHWVDIRHVRHDPSTLTRHDATATLAATIRGVPKDEIFGEDLRQHRRLKRIVGALIAAVVLLTVQWVVIAILIMNQVGVR